MSFMSFMIRFGFFTMMGCAPFSSMPPPAHFASDRSSEIGVIGGGGFSYDVPEMYSPDTAIFSQGYAYRQLSKKHSVGLKVQYGTLMNDMPSGGVFYRYTFHNDKQSYRGFDVDVGLLYVKSSYTTAWRQKSSQVYISPSVAFNLLGDIFAPDLTLPVGYTLWLGKEYALNMEIGGLGYSHPSGNVASFDWDIQLGMYAAFGLSTRF